MWVPPMRMSIILSVKKESTCLSGHKEQHMMQGIVSLMLYWLPVTAPLGIIIGLLWGIYALLASRGEQDQKVSQVLELTIQHFESRIQAIDRLEERLAVREKEVEGREDERIAPDPWLQTYARQEGARPTEDGEAKKSS